MPYCRAVDPMHTRDILPHRSLQPARDAVQFQKWVLSRHKAIRIVPARLIPLLLRFYQDSDP